MKANRFRKALLILASVNALAAVAISQSEKPGRGEESPVVAKLNQYVQKALTGQWRLSCSEDVQREENRYEVVLTKRSSGENVRRWDLRKTLKSAAAYEYRLSLKGKKITEKRLALAADNELLYEGKDSGAILPYKDKNIVFNPLEIIRRITLGEDKYREEGPERLGDQESVRVHFDSLAATGEPAETWSGKIWVLPETGTILKMTLEPSSWAFFEREEIPKAFDEVRAYGHAAARRVLHWTAEFQAEDRGIRFPSRVLITEEFEDEGGERLKTNTWTIRYDAYRFAASPAAPAVDPGNPVLKKAADYCERLKTIALQYICDEHISRTSYFYSVRSYVKSSGIENVGLPRKRWTLKRTIDRDVVYDYQLVKKGESLEEKRKALRVDGKAWTKKEEPENILPYQARYIVYGPIGFLSASWQTGFEYFDEGREKTEPGRETVVFMSQPKEFREDNSVYGRLWIDPESGAVVRIVWDPESIEFFRPEEVPEMFKGLEKQLVWTAYYEIEKNGIYFPSRQVIREQYIGPEGEIVLGDIWTITYENYKFFTVGVDIEIKK